MKIVPKDRKKVLKIALAVSLGLAVLFGAYAGIAYMKEPTTTKVTYKTLYVEKGELVHSGFFTNETVYKNSTSLEYYPTKITSLIVGNYTYSTMPREDGHYTALLHINYYVTSNKKKVYIANTTKSLENADFTGTFSIPMILNITEMDSTLQEIREGTGLYRAESEVYMVVNVNIENRDTFTHKITLVRDTSGMLRLADSKKEYKKVERYTNTTVNYLNFAGKDVSVSTGRTAFPTLAMLFLIPPLGFAYTKKGRKKKDELKGLSKFIVNGIPSEIGTADPIELNSVKDLERVFDLVDKPIVHYVEDHQDIYVITDGEMIYRYRRLRPKEDKRRD